MKNISFIGSGNVASHLAIALFRNNFSIKQVFSKSFKNANSLAKKVNAQPIESLSQLSNNAELYIIAVPDDAIENIVNQFPFKDKLVVHTSGSVNLDSFSKKQFQHFGILYPLQTFSKKIAVDFKHIPFCLEANTSANLKVIEKIAKQLSDKVYKVNSEQRKLLHLAAVFACNFSNNMYQIAYNICQQNQLNFDILKPLIVETANKIVNQTPLEAQTGPAKRNDVKTIEKHLALLDNQKKYQEIYRLVTENILSN
ncbi:MAG: DUF2520 domain-containing protein [Flavobacteriales bacterium]|nr:DUF2520 domain-containing protein [Flavobacteriales bacterium]